MRVSRRRVSLSVLAAMLVFGSRTAAAGDALWIAKAESVTTQITAYAVVEPRVVVPVRAGTSGVLRDLTVQPGDTVAAGAVLGRLAGPAADAALTVRQNTVTSAEAALNAAQQALAIERQKQASRLSTRGAVDKAAAAVSDAQARRDTARAELIAAQDMVAVRAPQAGQILTIEAAAGERLTPGDTILTLLPNGSLWLSASLHGADADAVRPGMTGRFIPADGGAAIPVKVRAVPGTLRHDGGRVVDLVADDTAANWIDGEFGTVTVDTGTVTGVAVPNAALVLDQAHWWVLVRTDKGDKPQEITPGPSRNGMTIIASGLAPGTAVVVANAYLEFHHGIGQSYQPPD